MITTIAHLRIRFPSALRQVLLVMAVAAGTWSMPPAALAEGTDAEAHWRRTLETGRSALDSGNLVVAENFVRQAIHEAKNLGPAPANNLALAESYEAMAEVQAKLDDMARAQHMMNEALAIRRATQPSNHPDLGRAALRFADLMRQRGDYDQAERLYRDSIDAITSALGPTDVLLADAYYGLALNEMEQGRIESADKSLLRSLSILGIQDDRVVREHLPDLRSVAERYQRMGLTDDAVRVMRQAMNLYERHYAVDHPYFEQTMLALGTSQLDRGLGADARGTFDNGTDKMLVALGPSSERVATTMEKIAGLFDTYEQPDDAEAFYKKALATRQNSLGVSDAQKVRSLVKLGDLARQRGETTRAADYYREAIQIGETRLGPNEVETAYAYSNMALILWDSGQIAEADRLWERALAIYEQRLGAGDATVATVAFNLGQLRHGQSQYDSAEALYRKALDIRERTLGPTHPDTIKTINMYALLLDRVGRPDEAAQIRARVK
ncbi:MAG: tetratricopeptide repeat protein [Alphaproteobacteria bacterium]|nr:tetratricopeptide repeat protein [Alphaproteobacteria bacterium]